MNNESTQMQVITEKLIENTQDLKKEFLDKTVVSAVLMYKDAERKLSKSQREWFDMFNVPYKVEERFGSEYVKVDRSQSGGFTPKSYYDMEKAKDKLYKLKSYGLSNFIDRELKDANKHYLFSVEKLANRLIEKGVTGDFQIKSGRVGVNFEIVITHDGKTTRAWTIIASGEVQRPHYRYLVK